MNDWKNIWEKRSADEKILKSGNKEKIFLELKRSNGFDVIGEGLSYEALLKQSRELRKNLFLSGGDRMKNLNSAYEVGCGSGANLYLFEQDGMECGGIDYSDSLVRVARQVLKSSDLICGEAIELPVEKKYDAVFSLSVFSYFQDEKYALDTLEKMYCKTNYAIGLLDLHDARREQAFLEYRRKTVENYEERYKNLPKLFYHPETFERFAREHDMELKFTGSNVEGYWNNEFVFHCFMYKKQEDV